MMPYLEWVHIPISSAINYRKEVKVMLKKFVYGSITMLFAVIGLILIYTFASPMIESKFPEMYWPVLIGGTSGFVTVGILIAPRVVKQVAKIIEKSITLVSSMSLFDLIACVIGLIPGLIIATLIGSALDKINIIGNYLYIICIIFFGYLGMLVGYRKRNDIEQAIRAASTLSKDKGEKVEKPLKKDKHAAKAIPVKVLDTSVIIDGRIPDIFRTGFIEGELIVAGFVLTELQHVADSADPLRRQRGRKGLDTLNELREEFPDRVRVVETDYPDTPEVDAKLLRLAQDLHGIVLTNDYNLNKVAQMQGVTVLNINELANAVRVVVLPGEEMTVQIIREGKEANQGLAYLEDGTMIVVENARRSINRYLTVIVTSVLQTAAGRMVFARPKTAPAENMAENTH